MGEVGQRAAGALEADGVAGVGSGESVPRDHGVSHEPLPVPAPAHRLLLIDLGLPAPHLGAQRRLDGVLGILGEGFLVLRHDAAAALSGWGVWGRPVAYDVWWPVGAVE